MHAQMPATIVPKLHLPTNIGSLILLSLLNSILSYQNHSSVLTPMQMNQHYHHTTLHCRRRDHQRCGDNEQPESAGTPEKYSAQQCHEQRETDNPEFEHTRLLHHPEKL